MNINMDAARLLTTVVLLVHRNFIMCEHVEPKYLGCYELKQAHIYKLNWYFQSWNEGLRGCEHRLTTHLAVQTQDDSGEYRFYCDNDLVSLSPSRKSSLCQQCAEDQTKFCGGTNVVSVYAIRDKVPLGVMIAVKDIGVLMIRDDVPRLALLTRYNMTANASFDYNYEEDKIYISEHNHVNRFDLRYNNLSYVETGEEPMCNGSSVRGLAVDWYRDEMVYTCGEKTTLQAVDDTYTHAVDVLTHTHHLRDVAYDPYTRELFFTDVRGRLFRYEVDSKLLTDLSQKAGLTQVKAVSIDRDNRAVYVVEEKRPGNVVVLLRVKYDGSNQQLVYQGPEFTRDTAKMDVLNGTVVWITYNNTENRSILYRCDLDTKNVCNEEKLKRSLVSIKYLSDLKIYHPLKQVASWKRNLNRENDYNFKCPPPPGDNVVCTYKGKPIPCSNSDVPPGTKAEKRCENTFVTNQLYLPESASITCQDSGAWDPRHFYCNAECGIPSDNVITVNIINGQTAERGEFPWQAALYKRSSPTSEWEQYCGGTLISPHLVLTAAHCIVLTLSRLEAADVKVGLGKIYRDINKQEPFSIIASVGEVRVPPLYLGDKSYYAQDAALLRLTEKVEFNDNIRPACVDWGQTIHFTSGQRVYVSGWGGTGDGDASEVLLYAKLKYLDLQTCLQRFFSQPQVYITYDKFCAEMVNGSQVMRGDSGGGMTAVRNKQHFVIGIVSAGFFFGDRYTMFTNISSLDNVFWLKQERNQLETAASLSKVTSENPPKPVAARCPPLRSVDYTCVLNNNQVSCESDVEMNTVATPRCKQNYLMVDTQSSVITCLSVGRWSGPLAQCSAVCGTPSVLPSLILNGNHVRRGEVPWQAALYSRNMPNGTVLNNWNMLCGGTLISNRLILTAAHCLKFSNSNTPLRPKDLKVGLGKIQSEFLTLEPDSIITDVRDVLLPENYKGDGVLSNDVALIDLVQAVQFNTFIMPACVDWTNVFQMKTGENAHVAGWMKTEDGTISEILQKVQMKFLTINDCIEKFKNSVNQFVSQDKFCGESKPGKELEAKSGGAGITAVKNGQHFVVGVASTKIMYGSTLYKLTMFTDLSYPEHMSWLRIQTIINTVINSY